MHWRLDRSLGEDQRRIRRGCGAENFSRVRRIVVNKLKNDPRKVSVKTKRYRRSIERQYLLDILRQQNHMRSGWGERRWGWGEPCGL
ncbi:MAG: hypothetical protein NTU53_22035 [Planctomycetota bacterium]|nr:hypothetical protein [Planctomycetota bacterium]